MSSTDPRRAPRRSVLSVPATDVGMLKHGLTAPADTVFFDLEDSVPADRKIEGRRNVLATAPLRPPGVSLGLRINDWSSPWAFRDLLDVVGEIGEYLDYVVLPKAEGPEDVTAVAGILAKIEHDRGIGHEILIEPIIESGGGLLRVHETLSASDRVFSVVFAPDGLDFAADMHFYPGVPAGYKEAAAVLPHAAARARGITLIDGPYVALYDHDGLRRLAQHRFRMGFDGKWAIHPGQVPIINEQFDPSEGMLDDADAVVAAIDEAAGRGRGAAVVSDTMVDVASQRLARVALDRRAAHDVGPSSRKGDPR